MDLAGPANRANRDNKEWLLSVVTNEPLRIKEAGLTEGGDALGTPLTPPVTALAKAHALVNRGRTR